MDCTIETLAERPALGIRTPVRISEIGDRIGELLPRLFAAASGDAAGAPAARWHCAADQDAGGDAGGEDPGAAPGAPDWDMEVLVPVARARPGAGDVRPATLPGGRAVVGWHVGSYDGLAAAWGEFNAWIDAHGHVRRAAPWEEYLGDCSVTPPDELRTKLVCPID